MNPSTNPLTANPIENTVIFTSPPRIGHTATIIVESPTPSQSDYADENVMSQQQPSWDFMAFTRRFNKLLDTY
jgi:hypothetical protein